MSDNNNNPLLYVTIRHLYGDIAQPLLMVDFNAFNSEITDPQTARKILKNINNFYDTHSDEDIERIKQEIIDGRTKRIEENYLKEFSKPMPTENHIVSKGYVYFLRAENGMTKIGRTTNLKNRFKTIQPKLPFKTTCVYTIYTSDYVKLESKLHDIFDHVHLNGEWYDLSPKQMEAIKNNKLPQDILDLIIEENNG